MKDENYIKKTIEQLAREKAEHQVKFAGNQAHQGCMPNFDRAIGNLENQEYHIVSGKLSNNASKPEAKSAGLCEAPRVYEPIDYTEAGDIGDEQMPAGEIKTDKKAWNYDASKNLGAEIPRKVKEFVAGL